MESFIVRNFQPSLLIPLDLVSLVSSHIFVHPFSKFSLISGDSQRTILLYPYIRILLHSLYRIKIRALCCQSYLSQLRFRSRRMRKIFLSHGVSTTSKIQFISKFMEPYSCSYQLQLNVKKSCGKVEQITPPIFTIGTEFFCRDVSPFFL